MWKTAKTEMKMFSCMTPSLGISDTIPCAIVNQQTGLSPWNSLGLTSNLLVKRRQHHNLISTINDQNFSPLPHSRILHLRNQQKELYLIQSLEFDLQLKELVRRTPLDLCMERGSSLWLQLHKFLKWVLLILREETIWAPFSSFLSQMLNQIANKIIKMHDFFFLYGRSC